MSVIYEDRDWVGRVIEIGPSTSFNICKHDIAKVVFSCKKMNNFEIMFYVAIHTENQEESDFKKTRWDQPDNLLEELARKAFNILKDNIEEIDRELTSMDGGVLIKEWQPKLKEKENESDL